MTWRRTRALSILAPSRHHHISCMCVCVSGRVGVGAWFLCPWIIPERASATDSGFKFPGWATNLIEIVAWLAATRRGYPARLFGHYATCSRRAIWSVSFQLWCAMKELRGADKLWGEVGLWQDQGVSDPSKKIRGSL